MEDFVNQQSEKINLSISPPSHLPSHDQFTISTYHLIADAFNEMDLEREEMANQVLQNQPLTNISLFCLTTCHLIILSLSRSLKSMRRW